MKEKDNEIIFRHANPKVPSGLRIDHIGSPSKLGDEMHGIHACVRSAFGREDFSVEDTEEHVKGNYILLAKEGEKVLGFSSLVFDSPRNIFEDTDLPSAQGTYFAAAVVARDANGRGIYSRMNNSRIDLALKRKDPILFTRTQNPLVETAITHGLNKRMDAGEITNYSLSRHYLPNCYGEMLSKERPPQSLDTDIQREHDRLNVEAGDAFILIYSLEYGQV